MNDSKKSTNEKRVDLLNVFITLIHEYTQYGDALDGWDAVKDARGNYVNGTESELDKGMTFKMDDEGNDAVNELFGSTYGATADGRREEVKQTFYKLVAGLEYTTVQTKNGPIRELAPAEGLPSKDPTVVPELPKN